MGKVKRLGVALTDSIGPILPKPFLRNGLETLPAPFTLNRSRLVEDTGTDDCGFCISRACTAARSSTTAKVREQAPDSAFGASLPFKFPGLLLRNLQQITTMSKPSHFLHTHVMVTCMKFLNNDPAWGVSLPFELMGLSIWAWL